MIEFKNPCKEAPYIILKEKYNEAADLRQENIEAIAISSYNDQKKEVDSRFVNLKFIDDKEFIFFSNYNSPKSIAFNSHNQIAALLYWPSTNVQIRMKANISKKSILFNQEYFKKRSIDKNALAICSKQSEVTPSYNEIKTRYLEIKKSDDLLQCPDYWGGFSFTPYYFEFWEGHESRLNKREVYKKSDNSWVNCILQP
ncbi:pyridoxamine 5'-phosphate oxidase family protein [Gammaproteobacteria bacterium]|nr:pyridoxamine 5'-phosphate oxidase family protein [Gammaproteobacteria bacterium]